MGEIWILICLRSLEDSLKPIVGNKTVPFDLDRDSNPFAIVLAGFKRLVSKSFVRFAH